ncbi:MAG: hypothetical protein KF906_02485 [Actinobacteria bacterium]|nr:hypothetical protein [Actinomycetota bacterium]
MAPGKTFDLTVSDPTDGDVDLDVVGHIDLSPASGSIHLRRATPGGALVDVAEDGWLLAKLALPSTDADTLLRVAGTLLLDDSLISVLLLGAGPNPVLHVLPTGTVVLLNSVVAGSATPAAIVNEGVLVARYSELIGFYAPAVHTATTGRTLVGASRVSSRDVYLVHDFEVPAVPACSGQFLESDGYNRVPNDSCALAEPTDLQSASSTWVDQIPPGTLGCGDFVVRDLNGQPRPADGDGDGISACDIGAKEWQPNP